METKEYTTIDRKAAGWPKGAWDNEPDKVQWPDETTGLPCLAVRSRRGNWCGYVGVPETHPLFGKGYDDLDVSVHGGITYADECQERESEAGGVCHMPSEGESENVWWFGFDCAHCYDHSPYDVMRSSEGYPWTIDPQSAYRTLQYVKKECERLAQQLKAME